MHGGAPLQGYPARGERIRGEAPQQHPGLFQPLIHLQRDDVPRPDVPFIEPQPGSGLPLQPACFSRSASRRTRGFSFALWLRKTSY